MGCFIDCGQLKAFVEVTHVMSPNAPKLSERLRELRCAGTETEQAGGVRGALPAGAQVVAGGVTGAAPAAGGSPENPATEGEAVRGMKDGKSVILAEPE